MSTFPRDFLFGSATASYQVEGAVAIDGRSPSVWDTLAHTPGKVFNNHHADLSADQYHRYPEDIAIMQSLGLQSYRFSFSWSRILPAGRGKPNQLGLDYYHRLIDALLAANISPWGTMFHWDFPQVLQDQYQGWLNRQSIEDFSEYTALLVRTYGDKMQNWFTMNEFDCFTDKCSLRHEFAPVTNASPQEAAQIRHNALVAHGRAVQNVRRFGRLGSQVGVAENCVCTIPVYDNPEHVKAARQAFDDFNMRFTLPILEGAYRPEYLALPALEGLEIMPGDLELIGAPLDFFGLNMYTPTWIKAKPDGTYTALPLSADYPRAKPQWLKIAPEIGYWASRFLHETGKVKAIYISENGASFEDLPAEDGSINDTARIFYLREHLRAISRACAEGVPIKGYFLWSLLDNFEWLDGYNQRFGIVHVNFNTLKRTPKLSALYYRELIAARRVL